MPLDDHAAHPQAAQADRHPKANRSAAGYQDLDFLPNAHRPTLLRKRAMGDAHILRLIELGALVLHTTHPVQDGAGPVPQNPAQGRAQNDASILFLTRARTGDLCGTSFK